MSGAAFAMRREELVMNRREALTSLGIGAAASLLARAGGAAPREVAAPAATPMTRDAARAHFSGIAIFAITPMQPRAGRAEVDFDGFARNVRFLVGHEGPYSLAVCGVVGEYHVLTVDERTRLVSIAAREKGKRLLSAGAGGDTTREAIANAEAVEKAGADAAIVLPSEAIGKGGDEAMLAHFRAVARAVGIGVIPYRSPVTPFGLETVLRLLEEPNVLAIKEQTGDLRFIRDTDVRTGGRIPLVPAHERMAPFAHLAGAAGITSGHANFAAARSIELWESLRAGRTREAMALADQFAELDRLRATYGDIVIKAGLELRGLSGGPLRARPDPLPAEGRHALERAMSALRVLEPAATA
jgi:4-hydroxy-tetrahydrodipicolinate synthase